MEFSSACLVRNLAGRQSVVYELLVHLFCIRMGKLAAGGACLSNTAYLRTSISRERISKLLYS